MQKNINTNWPTRWKKKKINSRRSFSIAGQRRNVANIAIPIAIINLRIVSFRINCAQFYSYSAICVKFVFTWRFISINCSLYSSPRNGIMQKHTPSSIWVINWSGRISQTASDRPESASDDEAGTPIELTLRLKTPTICCVPESLAEGRR